jgi:hypothetical protein
VRLLPLLIKCPIFDDKLMTAHGRGVAARNSWSRRSPALQRWGDRVARFEKESVAMSDTVHWDRVAAGNRDND